MNRIVVIGNGFDLAHGLQTKYEHFITHLKGQYVQSINSDIKGNLISENPFFCLVPKGGSNKRTAQSDQRIVAAYNREINFWEDIENVANVEYNAITDFGTKQIQHYKPKIKFKNSLLASSFENSLETTWGGIENDYKEALTKIITDVTVSAGITQAQQLNLDLKNIVDELVKYLSSLITPAQFSEEIAQKLYTQPLIEWRGKKTEVERFGYPRSKVKNKNTAILDDVLFLNFNYTSTINNYQIDNSDQGIKLKSFVQNEWISSELNTSIRYIHGDLSSIDSNPIIFGYGDEQDEHQLILERMNNEYFKHIKSVQYTRTPYYREMIDFADSDSFDVVIYGHSCSNTDRTLLNTLFEHQNCVSIQPYLHDTSDNSIYNNIYRCFKDKKLMRSRVVDSTNTIANRTVVST